MSETPPVVDSPQAPLPPSRSAQTWRILTALKWWHILTVFLVITLYWVAPIYRDFPPKEIEAIGGATIEAAKQAASGKHGPFQNPIVDVSVNPLVRGIAELVIQWNEKGETYVAYVRMTTTLRAENIILLWGLCLGAIIALGSAKPERQTLPKSRGTLRAGLPGGDGSRTKEVVTAEQALSDDVTAAANRAADIYRRSTFLLAGGS